MLSDPLFLSALLAGGLFAGMAAPLGAFVVWRRMAYFGEALAHATLLGVGLGLMLGFAPQAAVLPVMVAVALAFGFLERRSRVPADTLLAILAHGSLALGIILVSITGGARLDLVGWLFGDVLAVGRSEILLVGALVAITAIFFALAWRGLLSAATSEELAMVEGVPTGLLRMLFTILLALAVAVGMRIVGLLLVMALLVVPVATVRPLVRGPEAMVAGAMAIGVLSVLGGLLAAFRFDWPAGPAIALLAVLLFFASQVAVALGILRADGR